MLHWWIFYCACEVQQQQQQQVPWSAGCQSQQEADQRGAPELLHGWGELNRRPRHRHLRGTADMLQSVKL